jgi:hypothetical protein
MLRCSLCLFVLISLVGTVSVAAWRIRPPGLVHCREVQRQCELECGRGKCTVKRRCCLKGAKICYDQTKVETVCNSFQCLNGGTRVSYAFAELLRDGGIFLCSSFGQMDVKSRLPFVSVPPDFQEPAAKV